MRHPGYVGLIPWILSFPLLLTSPRALLPAGLAVICLVVRTALELMPDERVLRVFFPELQE